jgi:hypothetical protein
MAEQMRSYFDDNSLFFSGQHGFRANHSCESAIHELVTQCLIRQDKRLINLLLFIDFKKAFDMVDYKLLLTKLCNYGFTNRAIGLLENYFVKRKQIIRIGQRQSSFTDVTLGVPQGSVLGPLLFLIFINDLPAFLDDIYTKLFADDTTLLFSALSTEECLRQGVAGITRLMDWCDHNRLYINWSKTFIMFVSSRRGEENAEWEQVKALTVGEVEIKAVENFRLLGITLDTKLSFVKHASDTALSATRKMFALKRIFYLSHEVRVHFLKTFVLPCFDFGLSLIIYYSQEAIDKLMKAFYNCVFHIFKIDCSLLSTTAINAKLSTFRLSSLESRIFAKLSIFGFKVKYDRKAPCELQAQLGGPVVTHNYSLRGQAEQMVIPTKVMNSSGERTFGRFYGELLNKNLRDRDGNDRNFVELRELYLKFTISQLKEFKNNIFRNQDLFTNKFLTIFPRFAHKINLSTTTRWVLLNPL